jgi:hypothetical protein
MQANASASCSLLLTWRPQAQPKVTRRWETRGVFNRVMVVFLHCWDIASAGPADGARKEIVDQAATPVADVAM